MKQTTTKIDPLVEGFRREFKLPHRDGVYSVEGYPDNLLTQQINEVVLAHQQRPAHAHTHKNTCSVYTS